MSLKKFIQTQIDKGKTSWESRSALIRAAGETVNGHSNRILKEYENKLHFGLTLDIKNKEIKKFFDKQPKNSLISVEGAVKIINQNLPKKIQISETIIYNRLKDLQFNTKNLKGQTLDNQVSKTELYDIKITKEFSEKVEALRRKGVYLYIEKTQRGGNTLRLKMFKNNKIVDKSFPPNNESLEKIKLNYL